MSFNSKKSEKEVCRKEEIILLFKLEESLQLLKENMRCSQELVDVGSWTYNLLENKIFLSDQVFSILECNCREFEGKLETYYSRIYPDDLEKVKEAMEGVMTGKEYDIEYRIVTPAGSIKYVHQKAKTIYDEKNKPVKMVGIIQDITNHKVLENNLRAIIDNFNEAQQNQAKINGAQRRFQELLQASGEVFEVITPDGTIKYISEASEKVIGYKPEERVGKKMYAYYQGEDLQKLHEMVDFVLAKPGQKARGNVVFRAKSGKAVYLAVQMENLLDEPAVRGIVVSFQDKLKRAEMENQIVHIITQDELTELPNRNSFIEKLDVLCQWAKSANSEFAVIILDIDGFKFINDALGYLVGNKLIISIAERLKSFLGDTYFISRYSVDCFGIIVPGLGATAEYKKIANRIIALFDEIFTVDKYELNVTISMGISVCRDDEEDSDNLIQQAEIALFWAKKAGKNKYKFYSSDISIQDYKQFELRNDLRKAMVNRDFQVYYQPLVNLKTNEIMAAEALIRWQHDNWRLVESKEFINLAEETGQITKIGNWILREVCRHYKEWLKKGLPKIKVCVNFSSLQFFEENFVENIQNTIDDFGLDPHFLIMEITESILIVNAEKAEATIKRLKSLGIQIALDDFGTGYSSLSYLNNFSIDILKLDGSFVKNSTCNKTSHVITKLIIKMAQELKIKLVAEGIENEEQLTYLKELNCDTGQGYLYAQPMPLKEFELILAKKAFKPAVKKAFSAKPVKNKRKLFRVKFPQLLETDLTVLEIKGKRVNVGNTKVLVRDMGPGGLCYISNIKLPPGKDLILQFVGHLLGTEIKVRGYTVWAEEIDHNLHKYGVQFTIDDDEKAELFRILNQVQIKMRKNILFAEGSFVSVVPAAYFKIIKEDERGGG